MKTFLFFTIFLFIAFSNIFGADFTISFVAPTAPVAGDVTIGPKKSNSEFTVKIKITNNIPYKIVNNVVTDYQNYTVSFNSFASLVSDWCSNDLNNGSVLINGGGSSIECTFTFKPPYDLNALGGNDFVYNLFFTAKKTSDLSNQLPVIEFSTPRRVVLWVDDTKPNILNTPNYQTYEDRINIQEINYTDDDKEPNHLNTSVNIKNTAGTYNKTYSNFGTYGSLTGLTSNTPYIITITCTDKAGNISNPTIINATTPLSTPKNLTPSSSTGSTSTISWNSVTGATGYNIYKNGAEINSTTSTSFALTALCPSTAYTIEVSAYNSAGESQKASLNLNTLNIYITGPTAICSNGATYNLINLPYGPYLNWTYSSNIESYYGGNNYIALRAKSGANGTGWVKVSYNSPCGVIQTDNFVVQVGIPSKPDLVIQQMGYSCEFEAITATKAFVKYLWSEDGVNYFNGTESYGSFMPNSYVTIYLKESTLCGVSPITNVSKTLPKAPAGCMW